jgi:hypothetical protein
MGDRSSFPKVTEFFERPLTVPAPDMIIFSVFAASLQAASQDCLATVHLYEGGHKTGKHGTRRSGRSAGQGLNARWEGALQDASKNVVLKGALRTMVLRCFNPRQYQNFKDSAYVFPMHPAQPSFYTSSRVEFWWPRLQQTAIVRNFGQRKVLQSASWVGFVEQDARQSCLQLRIFGRTAESRNAAAF